MYKYPLIMISGHELNEVVIDFVKLSQHESVSNVSSQALDAVHSIAYHQGLGNPLIPSPSAPLKEYISAEGVAEFSKSVYTKATTAVVASGANANEVSKWVGQFFTEVPATPASGPFSAIAGQPSKYYGGEQRIPSQAGNAVVIAFPGSSSFGTNGYRPEFNVLSALLGGQSTIKWSPGSSLLSKAVEGVSGVSVSTKQATYSDAGLLYVTIAGGRAESVGKASKNVVDTIKKIASGEVASEDIKKAIALAKFRALESAQNLTTGVEVTGSALVHGNKPFHIAEFGQSIEKVTEGQVKAVRIYPTNYTKYTLYQGKKPRLTYNFYHPSRPPNLFSKAEPPSPALATSSTSPMPLTLVSLCKYKATTI